MADALTCSELFKLVTDYLDGSLGAADRERFDSHLADCIDCSSHLDQVRHTVAAAGRLRASDLSPDLRNRLLVAFRDWRHAAS
jgi:anti-sigma factor RsiW